tara:strand:+ start:182 stop:292 length:111 start_codon:yes stop_codon:yes gene_type:complete
MVIGRMFLAKKNKKQSSWQDVSPWVKHFKVVWDTGI